MKEFFREVKILRQAIIRYIVILLITFFSLLFVAPDMFGGKGDMASLSLANNAFLLMKQMLVPSTVPIVALGPVAPFAAPIMVALLLALLFTFPIALFLLGRFFSPALLSTERKTLVIFALPTMALFYGGVLFAYFFIIPKTFSLLYSFADPADIVPLFALDQFLSSTFTLMIMTGIVFLLPIVMVVLSRIGLIAPSFWVRHWRGAILTSVLFSAIVTPDGSGVTMTLLTIPLFGLYAAGTVSVVISTPKRVI